MKMSRSISKDAVLFGEEAAEEAERDIMDIERDGEEGAREAEAPEVLMDPGVFE